MSTVSFLDGDGIRRFANVTGQGTQENPYVFNFDTPVGIQIPIYIESVNPNTSISVSNFGVVGDTASVTGSFLARLRFIANVFAPSNRYVSIGIDASKVVSGGASSVISAYVFNKSNSIRYFQLFNQTSLPANGATPTESYVLAPKEKFNLDTTDFGLGGALFSSGLTWAISTTEQNLNVASASDVTTIIRWKSA